MFPIILNGVDEDDEDLLLEVNGNRDNSNFNETSPLFQDNLRCSIGRRLERRFSSEKSTANQPAERIIEIKSESEDEYDNLSSTVSINAQANLLNNYGFQRFIPIRLNEHNLNTSNQHSQARVPCNYQVLKSKKRFTFPICFFVGLYISFLVLSSIIFTMFEQKLPNTNQFFELQKKLMSDLTSEQNDMIQNLLQISLQVQQNGGNVISILKKNRKIIESYDQMRQNNESYNRTFERMSNFKSSPLENLSYPYISIITNQIHNRKAYSWDFQQALFYVVSIATTIGYGNLVPESIGGKIYTIIFGMISIPFTTILFSIIVSKFSNGPLRRFKLSLLANNFKEKSHETLRIIRFVCLILATFFIIVLVIGLPAFLFIQMEKRWSYLDGFYFIFISITTTGLGDYVPEFFGTFHHWIYELIVIIFLYFGIIMVMLWLTLIKSVFRRSVSIKLDEYDRDEEDRHEAILEEQVLINYHFHRKNYVNYGSFYGYDEVSVQVPK